MPVRELSSARESMQHAQALHTMANHDWIDDSSIGDTDALRTDHSDRVQLVSADSIKSASPTFATSTNGINQAQPPQSSMEIEGTAHEAWDEQISPTASCWCQGCTIN